ncbi:MAG TPA: DNA-processing protein DprA [Candidatus Acidoferrales bacterium]|nr:DNA-processing protein DprA [Candidatus Acidoferrales bacterium]
MMAGAAEERERTAALALLRVPGIGPITFERLVAHFGSCAQVLAAGDAAWMDAGLPANLRAQLRRPNWPLVESDLRWLEMPQHHLLRLGETAYPQRLAILPGAPPLLFVKGDPEVLDQPAVAIVGSRNPSGHGRRVASDFAGELVHYGLVITSGLAVGIDAAAHRGALAAGGLSVAVCGTGLDTTYPRSHARLAEELAAEGALVSEWPPGTPALPAHFPRRNRIISGLTLGTLVVEAALRSGSLITARLAAEQGREVFAIPGSIDNPLARGCHALIRQGAKLVESAADILEELPAQITTPRADQTGEAPPNPGPSLDPETQTLLDALGHAPASLDELVERAGLTPQTLSSMLLSMELQGLVEILPGGRYGRLRR